MNHTSSNIEIDRPLTPEEHSVVQWLLEHGGADHAKFLEQLGRARVASLCGCGCASIDFAVSGKRPRHLSMRILSDYRWRDDRGHLFGAYVFERDGLLAGLDLWSIDGQSTPAAMPPITRLVPIDAAQV